MTKQPRKQKDTKMGSLEDSFVAMVWPILNGARQAIARGESRKHLVTKVRFVDNAPGYHYYDEIRDNHSRLVSNQCLARRSSPESVACERQHIEAGVLKVGRISSADGEEVQNPSMELQCDFVYTIHLCQIISRLVDRHTLDTITEKEIREEYKAYFRPVPPELDFIVPLVNLTVDKEYIIGPFDVIALPPHMKTAFWCRCFGAFPPGFADIDHMAGAKHALHIGYLRGSKEEANVQVMIPDVMTALRLAKEGDVGASFALQVSHRNAGGTMATSLNYRSRYEHIFGSNRPYTLTADDIPVVVKLYDQLQKLNRSNKGAGLTVALSRFHMSYTRESLEDQIIDLAICLESCLLTDVRDELNYRLALRAAALTSGVCDSKAVFDTLKTMYKVHSNIVHSGKSLIEKEQRGLIQRVIPFIEQADMNLPVEFVRQCTEICRTILRCYCAQMAGRQTIRAINEGLDERIIFGLQSSR